MADAGILCLSEANAYSASAWPGTQSSAKVRHKARGGGQNTASSSIGRQSGKQLGAPKDQYMAEAGTHTRMVPSMVANDAASPRLPQERRAADGWLPATMPQATMPQDPGPRARIRARCLSSKLSADHR